jgi:hypothetical protein
MSTLKVTNIQSNGAGFNDVVSFQNASGTQNGTLCRTWVNFNGTGTVAIRSSFNVSSITDNGTGDYTVNFTTAMVDANYSVNGSGGDTSESLPLTGISFGVNSLSAGSFRFQVRKSTTVADIAQVFTSIFR